MWFFYHWPQKHGKVYPSELEELRRYTIWQSKKAFVEEHNRHADKFGYTLAVNKFSDMEKDEITTQYKGLKMTDQLRFSNHTKFFKSNSNFKPIINDTVDWRDRGAVTPVKNQGQCGSSWAFSATGAIEGQHFLKTKQLISLSEQNLVDCARGLFNDGCNRGFPFTGIEYVISNGGIDTEESYPYEASSGACRFSPKSIGATVTGYVYIPSNESGLLEAVATVGPISVSIDASKDSFMHYDSGVYYEPLCSSYHFDHAVLVVGYGTHNGQDYWLVKNSWGEDWGMEGYIMMARNKDNNCGIATLSVCPTV